MLFEHEVEAGRETDALIHELPGRTGEPPRYSSDKKSAEELARTFGVEVLPMHEPNRIHFFDSLGVLPEGAPCGYLGFLEVEPDDMSGDLLLLHGWRSLSEAETGLSCIYRSVLLFKGLVEPRWVTFAPRKAKAWFAPTALKG